MPSLCPIQFARTVTQILTAVLMASPVQASMAEVPEPLSSASGIEHGQAAESMVSVPPSTYRAGLAATAVARSEMLLNRHARPGATDRYPPRTAKGGLSLDAGYLAREDMGLVLRYDLNRRANASVRLAMTTDGSRLTSFSLTWRRST